jgi:uncharacterized protein (TIGR00255 family)
MIQSMTGYAAAAAESPKGRLSLELRSVNSRFLDLQFRVADELRALEPMLRERITSRIARGKIDCRLFLNDSGGASAPQALDPAVLAQLKTLAEQARRSFPDAGPLRLGDVLRWPGALAQPHADDEALGATVQALCDRALDELTGVRRREGEKLAAVVAARIADMRARVEAIAPLVPEAVAAYRKKLEERLQEAMGSGHEERIRAEMALFAAKVDIDEELERLRAHCSEVDRTLRKGGVAGKRLDFLAQELNREANTLASKAASGAISDCALELKLLVEQVREQVQNIE